MLAQELGYCDRTSRGAARGGGFETMLAQELGYCDAGCHEDINQPLVETMLAQELGYCDNAHNRTQPRSIVKKQCLRRSLVTATDSNPSDPPALSLTILAWTRRMNCRFELYRAQRESNPHYAACVLPRLSQRSTRARFFVELADVRK